MYRQCSPYEAYKTSTGYRGTLRPSIVPRLTWALGHPCPHHSVLSSERVFSSSSCCCCCCYSLSAEHSKDNWLAVLGCVAVLSTQGLADLSGESAVKPDRIIGASSPYQGHLSPSRFRAIRAGPPTYPGCKIHALPATLRLIIVNDLLLVSVLS